MNIHKVGMSNFTKKVQYSTLNLLFFIQKVRMEITQECKDSHLQVLWVIFIHSSTENGISEEKLLTEVGTFYRKPIYPNTLKTILASLERQGHILKRNTVIITSDSGTRVANELQASRGELLKPTASPRIPMRA